MSIIKKQRTREAYMFKSKLLAQGTKDGIKTALDNFERFGREVYKTEDLASELKIVEEEVLFDTLQEWINWNEVAPSTLALYFSRIKDYLYYRGVKITPQDVKHELKFPRRIEEELYGVSREEIQLIFTELNYKYRLIFLCQLSALMRIGETMQLRKKNFDTNGKNIIIHIPAPIAKYNKARTTFLSTEASKMLRSKLNRMGEDDLVFTQQENYRIAETNAEQALRRALDALGLGMRYESTNYYKINTHSFRAYGITKVSRIDENLAKKIAGQKGYLLQYDRLDDVEKLEIYKKCDVKLIIDNIELEKAKNQSLVKENTDLKDLFASERVRKAIDFINKHSDQ